MQEAPVGALARPPEGIALPQERGDPQGVREGEHVIQQNRIHALTTRVGWMVMSGQVCTMCAQREGRVRRPVLGQVAVICDGCLDLCNDIVDEAMHTDWDRWRAESGTAPCSFCGGRGEDVGGILIGYQGARICRDCIDRANRVPAE